MNKLFFEYKGHVYYYISNSSLKNPTTGEWHPAICYKRYHESPTRIYVRDEEDFKSKFKPVDQAYADRYAYHQYEVEQNIGEGAI